MQQRSGFLLVLSALLAASTPCHASKENSSPIEKVIELMTNLQAHIVKDGEVEAGAYRDFYEWCEDAAREKQNEIKTLTGQKGKLEATIEKAASDIEGATTKIDEASSQVASDKADLKDATVIREKEHADFVIADKELMQAVDMLTRAVNILEREMQGGSSLVQAAVGTDDFDSVIAGVSAVIDAASFSTADTSRLTALLQSRQDDEDSGAPAPDAYKSQSAGIVEVLEDMKEKAEGQLGDSRKAETNAKQNYDLLKQSLVDAAANAEKDLADLKSARAKAGEEKATAEGELEVATKGLASAHEVLKNVQADCMQKAQDHDATLAGRKKELSEIAKAKKIIQASTGGAAAQTYSFLQLGSSAAAHSRKAVGNKVVGVVKRLAARQHSAALAQLASRISAVLRYGSSSGDDPFVKVKGLISEMIAKLMKEANDEADEKAYCDDEMKKTTEKKGELDDEVADLSAKIDNAAAASERLKDEVKELQGELAALSQLQSQMDKAREETHGSYVEAKADLEQGLDGVRKAMSMLRDYYNSEEEGDGSAAAAALLQDDGQASFSAFMQQPTAPQTHAKSAGAGSSIIGLLEVIESDLAKNLAQTETEESNRADKYAESTQSNKVDNAAKEQDVKYKTQEFKALDRRISELSGDRDTATEELTAVNEYFEKLKTRCIAKPEAYEERKRRREAEIEGLKEAIGILEGEAVFLQRSGNMRGVSLRLD